MLKKKQKIKEGKTSTATRYNFNVYQRKNKEDNQRKFLKLIKTKITRFMFDSYSS